MFVRDRLKRRWTWLCLELYLVFVQVCIASLFDEDDEGPQLEIGYTLRSVAAGAVSQSGSDSLKALAAAAVAGEPRKDILAKLEAYTRQLRDEIKGSTDEKRYRRPDTEKLQRNANWYYRACLGESINSIANELKSNSWAVVKDAVNDVHRVLSLPIEISELINR